MRDEVVEVAVTVEESEHGEEALGEVITEVLGNDVVVGVVVIGVMVEGKLGVERLEGSLDL